MPESNITKKVLASTLKELVTARPFEKVSVSDICDACGVSRKTFYYHFQDKYELAEWIFSTEIIALLKEVELDVRWEFISAVCRYFYQEKEFYINLLTYSGQNSFRQQFQLFMFESLEKFALPETSKIRNIANQDGLCPDETQEFYTQFISDAILISIFRWLGRESKLPPDQFVARLKSVSAMMLARAEEMQQYESLL